MERGLGEEKEQEERELSAHIGWGGAPGQSQSQWLPVAPSGSQWASGNPRGDAIGSHESVRAFVQTAAAQSDFGFQSPQVSATSICAALCKDIIS